MMEQETKPDTKEILQKLARLQSDINYIKENIKSDEDKKLKTEIEGWEETSEEDTADFFEKHNL